MSGSLVVPRPIASHGHRKQLRSGHAHRDQTIEHRQGLGGGELVMGCRGRVQRRAVPVCFDTHNLLGEALANSAHDALQGRELSRLNLVAARGKHFVRWEFDTDDIPIHPGSTAGDIDRVHFLQQAIVRAEGCRGRQLGRGIAIEPCRCETVAAGVRTRVLSREFDLSFELADALLSGSELLAGGLVLAAELLDLPSTISELLFEGLAVVVGELKSLLERRQLGVEQLVIRIECHDSLVQAVGLDLSLGLSLGRQLTALRGLTTWSTLAELALETGDLQPRVLLCDLLRWSEAWIGAAAQTVLRPKNALPKPTGEPRRDLSVLISCECVTSTKNAEALRFIRHWPAAGKDERQQDAQPAAGHWPQDFMGDNKINFETRLHSDARIEPAEKRGFRWTLEILAQVVNINETLPGSAAAIGGRWVMQRREPRVCRAHWTYYQLKGIDGQGNPARSFVERLVCGEH